MGHAMVQMRIARATQLPEDVTVNTFHFITPTQGAVSATEAVAVSQKVFDFYTLTWAPSTLPVRNWLSSGIATTGHETRCYDMGQAKPRVPILTVPRLITPGPSPMPAEVACCLSYRGDLVSGTNPARRRGRIYIGPLALNVSGAVVNGDARPDAQFVAALLNAGASSLMNDDVGGNWAVHSQPDELFPAVLTPITHLYVDNAFDTQRRRGVAPTSRTVRDAPAT